MFPEARLKLKRANEHIAEVNRRIDAVVDPANQTTWTDRDFESGIQSVHYRINKLGDLPDIALILGDAIHNLRSALDYSWIQVITALVPGAIGNYSKFPVYPSLEQLKGGLAGRKINVVAPALFDLVVDKIKAYQGGNTFVCAIHQLDIQDKHRLLIPTSNYGSIEGLELKDDRRGTVHTVGSMGLVLENDTFHIAVAPGVTVQKEGRLPIEVVLKEGLLQSLEVRETLRILAMTSLSIVELLEGLIEG